MEDTRLVNLQGRLDFFQQRILLNLNYWRTWLEPKLADVAALDREQDKIVDAILFGLDVGQPAWSAVYPLITTFSAHMERRGHWDRWELVLERATEVAEQGQDRAGMVNLLIISARLRSWQSHIKEAVVAYRRIIRLARQLGDSYNEARACTNLGYLYTELGRWQRAEVLCCHALALFEQLDSDHGRAHTENHLGILYSWQGRWNLARQHLENACALWHAMGDQHGLMRGLINLGRLCNDQECPDEALVYLEKALHQAKLTGEEIELASIYTNIGIYYRLKSEYLQAEKFAWRAKSIFQRHSNLVGIAEVQDNLGLVCIDQNKWQEASLHFETALKLWREMTNQYGETRTLMYIVEYELARGERQRAAERLNEVERLINLNGIQEKYPYLRQKTIEYRRRLAEV